VRLAVVSLGEFGDGDGFGAAGAQAADPDGTHPGVAVLAALVAEGAGLAAGALVDGEGAAAAWGREGSLGWDGLMPAPVRRRPARR
jgi:hypothetical protein